MSLAQIARIVERDIFGALLGVLGSLLFCRAAVFVIDVHPIFLVTALLIGAWTGTFVAHLGVRRSVQAMQSVRSVVAGFRAVCLRAILWMLGIAAVLGVLAVLTGSFEVVGRVAATTALTGLAAGLLWPFLACFDDDRHWRVGMLGVASVITVYLLGMPSIWDIGFGNDESALSSLTVGLMAPIGLLGMFFSGRTATRISGFVTTIIYAGCMTLFLLSIWAADDWRRAEGLIESSFWILGMGSLAVVSTIHAGTGDRHYWRWVGFAAACFAAAMCIYNSWNLDLFEAEWVLVVTSIAVVVGHANLAVLAPLSGGQSWWKYATIAAVVVTAITLDLDVLLESGGKRGVNLLGRISLAAGILASTGTLALLILTRLSRAKEAPLTAGPIERIDLRCPRCGKRQTVPLGNSACSKCGLSLQINVAV